MRQRHGSQCHAHGHLALRVLPRASMRFAVFPQTPAAEAHDALQTASQLMSIR